MTDQIRVEKLAGGILSVVLNRPERKNAINAEMYRGLRDAIDTAESDGTVRVLLLSGGADFTSGNDLADFQAPALEFPSPGIQYLQKLSTARKPIVAAVEGYAVGIGTTMLLHCDMVFASETAKFKLPFVDLALCPEGASSYLLPKLAGYKQAARLLMLGQEFNAATAVSAGIATQVTPAGATMATALEHAQILARKPPQALRVTKNLLRRGDAQTVAETLLVEIDQFMQRRRSDEAKEAFQAFFEKRAPDFSRFE